MVLLASHATFRLDDVPETGHGDVDCPDAKDPALRPDRFEIEAGHDEGEIHVEARTVGRANEGAVRDHASREKAVAGSIEWFPPAPELEPHRLAHPPRPEGVVGVEGEEEVAVFGYEQRGAGSRVVIGGEADQHESYARPLVRPDEARECVSSGQRTRIARA